MYFLFISPSSPFQCCLVLQNDHLFLQYCLGEKLGKFNYVHNCEDRFHIRFFNRSSHLYDFHIFTVIYSPL